MKKGIVSATGTACLQSGPFTVIEFYPHDGTQLTLTIDINSKNIYIYIYI
jgi:hypothetical protein